MTDRTDLTAAAEPAAARYSRLTMSALRSLVGASTWLSPKHSTQVFAPGLVDDDAGTMVVGRLFAIRDLVLGQAVRHPDAQVRRAALQAGVVVDAADVAASLIAIRRGAPRLGAALVGAGALSFVILGATALTGAAADPPHPSRGECT